jgi:hypothetical protein
MNARRQDGHSICSTALQFNVGQIEGPAFTKLGAAMKTAKKILRKRKFAGGYQFVYVWQSKYESIPLCAVDAGSPSLQASSLFQEEGVYESKTDFAGNTIGRGDVAAGAALE